MKLVIETFEALPCSLAVFEIDNIPADKGWFGEFEEESCPEDCDGYDCHGKYFSCYTVEEIRKEIPEKFQYLSKEDIEEIQEELEKALAVGDCGWCV